MPAVALIGTLDTKGDEIAYVRERLEALRVDAIVIDSGILGEPSYPPDFTHEEVAAAGNRTLAEIRGAGSRGAAVALMQDGVRALVARLFAEGRVQACCASAAPRARCSARAPCSRCRSASRRSSSRRSPRAGGGSGRWSARAT
jgi:uncharacterized protein (UPF0261 family)